MVEELKDKLKPVDRYFLIGLFLSMLFGLAIENFKMIGCEQIKFEVGKNPSNPFDYKMMSGSEELCATKYALGSMVDDACRQYSECKKAGSKVPIGNVVFILVLMFGFLFFFKKAWMNYKYNKELKLGIDGNDE